MRAELLNHSSLSRLRQLPRRERARRDRAVSNRKRHSTGFEPFLLAALFGLAIWILLFWLVLF